MNRKERRAAGEFTASEEERVTEQAYKNAHHWAEIKTIKREYDALPDEEKAIRKPGMAADIDWHLRALGV